jgi:uncharacterized protein (TIGR03089 family)
VSSSRFLSADVPALMLDLISMDPGRPRVTWYGPDHERVEFSAKTLNNWVSKTANLLVDELDAGPGSRIGLALPGHWRTVVWLLAGWSVGAHLIVLPSAGPQDQEGAPTVPVDVLVTDRPSSPPPGIIESQLVVVALPALATRFLGDAPPGAIDAAAEVRLQPDVFVVGERPAETDPAFTAGLRTVPYADLMTTARAVTELAASEPAAWGSGAGLTDAADTRTGAIRLLTGAGPDRAIETYLAALAAGGSVVLHHALATLTEAERAHLAGQEAITAVDL